jgi:hypothetical protein
MTTTDPRTGLELIRKIELKQEALPLGREKVDQQGFLRLISQRTLPVRKLPWVKE